MSGRGPILAILFVLSLAGLTISCAVHIATLLGFRPDPVHSRLWEVQVVATLLIPAALLARWNIAGNANLREFFADAFRATPKFYRRLALTLFAYACVVGILTLFTGQFSGTSYLFSGNGVTDDLRVMNLRSGNPAYAFRLWTCVWIAGYSFAVGLLASVRSTPIDNP